MFIVSRIESSNKEKRTGMQIGGEVTHQAFAWRAGDRNLHLQFLLFHCLKGRIYDFLSIIYKYGIIPFFFNHKAVPTTVKRG